MINIQIFTKDKINDVIDFEKELRVQEPDTFFWNIDDDYKTSLINSFDDCSFNDSISLLAYAGNTVVGRIDSSMIKSHFDGSTNAYLDWICVIKSYRHKGVAQMLLEELRKQLKERGIEKLIALTAANEEAQHFYRSVPNSEMRDTGIWIDIK